MNHELWTMNITRSMNPMLNHELWRTNIYIKTKRNYAIWRRTPVDGWVKTGLRRSSVAFTAILLSTISLFLLRAEKWSCEENLPRIRFASELFPLSRRLLRSWWFSRPWFICPSNHFIEYLFAYKAYFKRNYSWPIFSAASIWEDQVVVFLLADHLALPNRGHPLAYRKAENGKHLFCNVFFRPGVIPGDDDPA